MQALLSIAEVSKSLRTNQNKVLSLIRSGELAAINVAQNSTGKRPRWRIAANDFEAFLESRRTSSLLAETKKTRKPKKRVFFP